MDRGQQGRLNEKSRGGDDRRGFPSTPERRWQRKPPRQTSLGRSPDYPRRGESRKDAVVIFFASDGLDEQDIRSYTAGLWERYRERFRDRLVRFEPCAGDPRVTGTRVHDPLDPKTDPIPSGCGDGASPEGP